MRSIITAMRQHVAALRMLIIFTIVLGVAYPLFITLVAQLPGLQSRADGSQIKLDGKVVGSKLLGRYRTPRSASGISATITTALKITAERIALCAECSFMTLSACRPG
jgi:hypothetical protein